MALRLRSPSSSPPASFSWDVSIPPVGEASTLPEAPTSWLSSKDMRLNGAEPMKNDLGVIRCKDCHKPVLKSMSGEHLESCIRMRKQAQKGGLDDGKKRKAEDDVEDPSSSKKKKAAPKVTKGRTKGPVDLDKQCGVINDKNLPCSRSLTCKSHSMGAKRAVTGRSRDYDELLLQWNREHNPNFVEPVKRETKAEKKEKREKEKAEKKRLAAEAAATVGAPAGTAPAPGMKKTDGTTKSSKKKKAAAAAAATTQALTGGTHAQVKDADEEDWEALDSEEELDTLIRSVHSAQSRRVIAQPLALPNEMSPWFVVRRERLRNCHHHLSQALNPNSAPNLSRPGLLAGTARIS